MYLLRRKIFDILVHLKNIYTLEGPYVRFSRRSREESQLQAEPDQDNCNDNDSVMRAHKALRLQVSLNADAGGVRNPNQNPKVEANLCLPAAADCQFVS